MCFLGSIDFDVEEVPIVKEFVHGCIGLSVGRGADIG